MRRGLAIVGRNFRTRAGEIDLIARDGATLVFVEVRMRRSQRFGGALESITAAKRARIVAAANGYLAFSAITMAAMDGIENKIHPGDPMDKDIYHLKPEE